MDKSTVFKLSREKGSRVFLFVIRQNSRPNVTQAALRDISMDLHDLNEEKLSVFGSVVFAIISLSNLGSTMDSAILRRGQQVSARFISEMAELVHRVFYPLRNLYRQPTCWPRLTF